MIAAHPLNAEVATVSQSLHREHNALFNQGMYASQLQISLLLLRVCNGGECRTSL